MRAARIPLALIAAAFVGCFVYATWAERRLGIWADATNGDDS